MKRIIKTILALGALLAPSMAAAQNYPSRQVTVVIPFAPGGSNDNIGRYLAEQLEKRWKRTVVVENRPGAGSAIGSAYVTKAKPDAYTLLFVSSSYTSNAATQKSLPFDPLKDLQPIGMAAVADRFISTGRRVPMGTLADLVREAKSQKIFYGTSGVGSLAHLTGELMNEVLGITMAPVHYAGGSEVMVDLGGGRIDVVFSSLTDISTGIGTPVAVMSERRSTALPNVPTVQEAGYPDTRVPNWWGVFAPTGTPKELIDRIHQDIVAVMGTAEAAEYLARQGAMASAMSTDAFATHVESELNKWKAVVEKQGVSTK
jgi:tripartite-type tricarboxylate transporter receptor subunit TctC